MVQTLAYSTQSGQTLLVVVFIRTISTFSKCHRQEPLPAYHPSAVSLLSPCIYTLLLQASQLSYSAMQYEIHAKCKVYLHYFLHRNSCESKEHLFIMFPLYRFMQQTKYIYNFFFIFCAQQQNPVTHVP